jgi:Tfp pilus assembly protein PilX
LRKNTEAMQNAECRIQDTGYRMQDAGCIGTKSGAQSPREKTGSDGIARAVKAPSRPLMQCNGHTAETRRESY